MLYISYQGIFDSQNFEDANTPAQIGKAFNAGYSCMVDAWRVDGQLYLGSYAPTTPVTEKYLQGVRFWINARNTDIQNWLTTQPSKLYPNYFSFPNNFLESLVIATISILNVVCCRFVIVELFILSFFLA